MRQGSRDFRWLVSIRKELAAKEPVLLETGKSGLFGVLPVQVFFGRKAVAFDSLFSLFSGDLKKLTKEVCSIPKESKFNDVAQQFISLSCNKLRVNFLLKDHRPDLPLRVVVSEKGTWKGYLSVFLQRCLSHLQLLDSLSLKFS